MNGTINIDRERTHQSKDWLGMVKKASRERTSVPTREAMLRHLSFCMNRAIWECPQDPSIVFRGCPETTQLAWRTADALGLGLDAVVMQGKAKDAEDGRWIDHIWVEIPSLGLRVETNASQILGRPQFVEVSDLSDFEERYRGAFEHMEFLDRVREKGDEFYWSLAQDVARCVRRRSRK